MALTIEQALRQGVAAHKEGKLQDAERLYRAILQSQPQHPDANHNLGVLAVSFNKADLALPLFKTALEANPKIEQFWLSYIDALIKEQQFDNAKQVLEQAKAQGVAEEKLNNLEAQPAPKIQTENVNSVSPPQELLNSLLGHYQNGRFSDAEKLAVHITQDFPKHQFSWKVLGAVLEATGRKSEAVDAKQTAVALSPQDAEAHSNLGNTLHKLGRSAEAVASCKQAIALKPDYAEAYSNLGNTLHELGRLGEAEASCAQAITLKPDLAEAHYNLGATLHELGRLAEALASCRQAIALKPDYAEAHNNLGATLKELSRLDEAEVSYGQAIVLKPDYAEARRNLGVTLKELQRYQEAISHFDSANDFRAIPQSLECLYIVKNYELLHERLQSLSKAKGISIGVAAVSAFVSHQLKIRDPYEFCKKPLEYVSVSNAREFERDADGLINEILKESDAYQLIWENRTTKFGFQGSGNIFENASSAISNLERIIGQALTKYYDNHKGASELFITAWPTSYKLAGWFNRLLKNGYQTSHIHPTGWLSGVIYLKTLRPSNNNAGAIEFSLHGHDLPIIDEDIPRQTHNPEEGDIVLFPSSLFHQTIPFTTDTERCVIAFDMIPAVNPTN